MGVRRAMEMVLSEANRKEGPLFTLGPLIHNKQVLDLLAQKGVRPVEDLTEVKAGSIVIRAHGIPPQVREAIKGSGLKVIDATCPKVAKVQAIVRYHTRRGRSAVIVGDRDHAEVIGLVGYGGECAHVIQNIKDISKLPPMDSLIVVAQTTQNEEKFRKVAAALKDRFPDVYIFDTICEATCQRQQEVRSFKDHVDALVVVGGHHSGNTQRLVDISKEVGVPVFHVETEKDLEKERFSGLEVVGVTAGASTPNWMIKDVVRKIEGIQGQRETGVLPWIKRGIKFLVLGNLLVAGGAFAFSYAEAILGRRVPQITFPSLALLYIYAMHVLNRFLDKGASAYNDPERAAFLNKHRYLLIITGILAMATALALSYTIGKATFLALSGFSALGIVYSIRLIPRRVRHRSRYTKIKDIPGSRSISEALAWVAVIAVLPLLSREQIIWPTAILATTVVLLMAFTRSAISDLFQVQGDLIVGTETLPITLGERNTLNLLKIILLATAFILAAGPYLGLVDPFSYMLLIPLLTLSLCLVTYERRWIHPGIGLEAMVEGNFLLAGLLGALWQVFTW
jgi:(E)-4-hydroxy-3-methyl-but-2-enyl pyrophosphate reductase